jgi:adenylate cyclase
MASMFRSISFKIFGVSLGLLIMMLAAAIWSARSTEQVNRQLRTLEASLFPLSVTLGELKSVVQAQTVTADYLLTTPDEAAVRKCFSKARAQQKAAATLLASAKRYRAIGSEIAVMERNKLALARLEPMLEELEFQENRLSQMTLLACPLEADAIQMGKTKAQADDVFRQANAISKEIDTFVEKGAELVADNQKTAMRANILMIGSAALVGLMLAWIVSRGLTRPIIRLQAGARAVGAGRLEEAHVPVTSRDEIGDVTNAFNAMILDLREKDRIKETFGQYVDPRIVADLIGGGTHASSGEKQVATLFFSDIVGFSSISERLAPSTVVDLVNAYFSEMSQPIREHSGIIDKYIGDAVMAFWVPPFVDATRQAELACRAALDQFSRLEAFRLRVPDIIGLRRDVPLIDFRVGLSTGEVVVGSVGSETARSFTVMGDTVNQASRLEAVNKVYGTRLLIDHETFSRAGKAFETRQIDDVQVVGRLEPLRIYELVALAGEVAPDRCRAFDLYEEGLDHYRVAEWNAAEKALQAALELMPNDGPTKTLLTRIAQFRQVAPKDWSGVWSMTTK